MEEEFFGTIFLSVYTENTCYLPIAQDSLYVFARCLSIATLFTYNLRIFVINYYP